jgi:RNA polymerase sigma-70 factor (ECF subfamily)
MTDSSGFARHPGVFAVDSAEEACLDDRWAVLYQETRPILFRAAALMVGGAEAEEVVQEAFERAMRNRGFFDEVREPLAWLRTATARRALGRLRRRRLWEQLRVRLPAHESVEPWERAALAMALAGLMPRDRVALVLRYYQDATYDEIAESLGIAASSVGPLLTRARAKIREALT